MRLSKLFFVLYKITLANEYFCDQIYMNINVI